MAENPNGLPDIAPDYDELDRQFDVYEKGRRLRMLVHSPEWEIVVQVLQDYRDKARDAVIALPPGHEGVMLAHAAASATNDVFERFQEDIKNAVYAAEHPTDELRDYIFGVRKDMDVKSAMEQ